jgi:hypothetical protein
VDRSIRSLPTFVLGLALVAFGLAVAVAEASPLNLAQTASVSALAAGVVALVAIIAAPRAGDGGTGRGDGGR